MSLSLLKSLSILADRFVELAERDESFRLALRDLARAVLDATEVPSPDTDRDPGPGPGVVSEHPAAADQPATPAAVLESAEEPRSDSDSETDAESDSIEVSATAATEDRDDASGESEPTPSAQPLPELTLGRSLPPSPPLASKFPNQWRPTPAIHSLVPQRCRLKARACRAMIARPDQPEALEEVIDEAATAKHCRLWMLDLRDPRPDPEALDRLAGCFEALAETVDAMTRLARSGREPERDRALLELVAEAQSALRVAANRVGHLNDPDQMDIYNWLRKTTRSEGVYLERYMSLQSPADPDRWPRVLERARAIAPSAAASADAANPAARRRRKLLGKIRHKAGLVAARDGDPRELWSDLVAVVEEFVADAPPSDRELRESLLPVVDDLPDDFPHGPGFALVLREIDRYLANVAETRARLDDDAPREATPEVREVAELLAGRDVVLIGGLPRPDAERALREAFRLHELVWLGTGAHQSIYTFEPRVARPEVALVLLAIRWSSHAYEDVKRFCEASGKPMVRLPGGYNPNQVAAQILSQCGDRLRRERPADPPDPAPPESSDPDPD